MHFVLVLKHKKKEENSSCFLYLTPAVGLEPTTS